MMSSDGTHLRGSATSTTRASAAGAIELPTVFVLGWLVFDDTVDPARLAAGALVIAAVPITPSRPPPAAVVEPGGPV